MSSVTIIILVKAGREQVGSMMVKPSRVSDDDGRYRKHHHHHHHGQAGSGRVGSMRLMMVIGTIIIITVMVKPGRVGSMCLLMVIVTISTVVVKPGRVGSGRCA